MTLCQRAALISSDAHTLYRRLDDLQNENAPLDRERAEEAARRIWEQVSELIVQLGRDCPQAPRHPIVEALSFSYLSRSVAEPGA